MNEIKVFKKVKLERNNGGKGYKENIKNKMEVKATREI